MEVRVRPMEKIEDLIVELIDREGIEYIWQEPFEVYKTILDAGIDPVVCRTLLSVLLVGEEVKAYLESNDSAEVLSKTIQRACALKKGMADQLAEVLLSVFSDENMSHWQKKSGNGFDSFCDGIWEYPFEGEETWHSGGGHVDCTCEVGIVFQVSDADKARKIVARELEKNPFLTEDALYEIFAKKLDEIVRQELYEYVTEDDYYQPYMGDFGENCRPAVERFCKESGLEILDFTCEGDEGEFERDGRW